MASLIFKKVSQCVTTLIPTLPLLSRQRNREAFARTSPPVENWRRAGIGMFNLPFKFLILGLVVTQYYALGMSISSAD